MSTAWKQLQEAAGGVENIEGLVFGAWGWGSLPVPYEDGDYEYEWGEPSTPVPV